MGSGTSSRALKSFWMSESGREQAISAYVVRGGERDLDYRMRIPPIEAALRRASGREVIRLRPIMGHRGPHQASGVIAKDVDPGSAGIGNRALSVANKFDRSDR